MFKIVVSALALGLMFSSPVYAQTDWGLGLQKSEDGNWETSEKRESVEQTSISDTSLERIIEKLMEDPSNRELHEKYAEYFPTIDDFIVIEGDIRIRKSELGNYFERISRINRRAQNDSDTGYVIAGPIDKKTAADPFLIINLDDFGNPDFYETFEERELTYSIDYTSFPANQVGRLTRYEITERYMEEGGKAWSNACAGCGIKFQHKKALDRGSRRPTQAEADFIVTYVRDAPFIASAFFPSDNYSNKILYVTESMFNGKAGADPLGVMRHELGHVLGFRHEHIRGIPGCRTEGNKWVALTEYDSQSVMHYLCGRAGTYSMELSQKDIAGLNIIYGAPGGQRDPDCQCD